MTAAVRQIMEEQNVDPEVLFARMEPVFKQEGYRDILSVGVQNILVVRLDKIGDFVLSSPFLRELRRNFPTAHITLIVNERIYNLAELCPYVNDVLTLPMQNEITLTGLKAVLALAREKLWCRYFDLAFCTRCGENVVVDVLVAYLSGARERVSYSGNVFGVQHPLMQSYELFNVLISKVLHMEKVPYQELERSLALLGAMGLQVGDKRPEIWYGKSDVIRVEDSWQGFGRECRMVAIGLGASEPRKTYPVELLLAAMQKLQDEQLFFVLLGGAEDRNAAEKLRVALPVDRVLNLVGKTTLRQTAAAIAKAILYIGNDTGMMHMAAASHVPVVEISCDLPVPSEIDFLRLTVRFEPWGTPYILLHPASPLGDCGCEPSPIGCMSPVAHCITQITPDEVAAAAKSLLKIAYHER